MGGFGNGRYPSSRRIQVGRVLHPSPPTISVTLTIAASRDVTEGGWSSMTGTILPAGPETVTVDPFNAQTPLASLADPVTPVATFFVRDHFGIPQIDPGRWRLTLGGAVDSPSQLGYEELLGLGRREFDLVLECAGNGRSLMQPQVSGLPWGERAVGCARFGGVPLREVVARAAVDPATVEFVFTGADTGEVRGRRESFERSLPVAVALHPDTLLATHMNGEPLTVRHGAPVRLVVPVTTAWPT
jgi:DMSO/TMAO reductase YedYZ molybdopterin-dependent catalytic subunit